MKIRTKIMLFAFVPLLVLAASALVQFSADQLVDREQHGGLLLGEFSRGLTALDLLILEQSSLSRERAHAQWTQKYLELGEQLFIIQRKFAGKEEQPVLERISKGYRMLGSLDGEYHRALKRLNASPKLGPESRALVSRIENRLREELHVMGPEVERLYEINKRAIEKVDRRRSQVLTILLVFVTIFCPVAAYLLYSSVVAPLERLQQGVARIAAGYMDFRLPAASNDEIAEFSRLFNEMIEKRKKSEQAVRRLNEELEERVAERTEVLNATLRTLEDSQRQLEDIIEFLPDATLVLDNDKRVIAWNRAIEEMTGVRKEEMLGQGDYACTVPFYGERRKHLLDLLDKSDAELEAKYQNVRRVKDSLFAEAYIPRVYGGKGAYAWVTGAPLYNSSGDRIGAIEAIRDISDRKQAEDEIRQAKESAEAANRAKSEFLANMSHEIRTPLNAINGMACLALQSGLTPRQHEYVNRISTSADLLLRIINDLLDYSKIEAGKLELETMCFNLDEVLATVRDLAAAMVQGKRLDLNFNLAPDTQAILLGDPLRLSQILNNLLSNAIKFTEQGGVELKVFPVAGAVPDGQVELAFAVSDTGIGMEQEHLERIFAPFTQADSSITRRFGGTGLGLSIVVRLLELMGSRLTVSSEAGRGSTFSFVIRFMLPPEHERRMVLISPENQHTEEGHQTLSMQLDGVDLEQLRFRLKTLAAALQEHDLAAVKQFEELCLLLGNPAELGELRRQIDRLEYAKALAALEYVAAYCGIALEGVTHEPGKA